jgi:hypothetical protein
VIRREFRQFEASWYDGQKIKLSRDRVDRLGFFTQVDIETQEVPGSPDQVDLMINVVEKPTGSIQLGAGFSSAEKVSLSFGIKQENVFGSGNYLGLDVNTSKYNRTMVVSTTNPYFTDTVSRAPMTCTTAPSVPTMTMAPTRSSPRVPACVSACPSAKWTPSSSVPVSKAMRSSPAPICRRSTTSIAVVWGEHRLLQDRHSL